MPARPIRHGIEMMGDLILLLIGPIPCGTQGMVVIHPIGALMCKIERVIVMERYKDAPPMTTSRVGLV
jgi:hypothetical protein